MDKIKVKMLKTFKFCYIGMIREDLAELIVKGKTYDAVSNQHGAISIIIGDGLLGVKPDEFEFVEAPAWVLQAHKQLVPFYEKLQEENKQLKEVLKNCSPLCICGNNFYDVVCKICNSINQHKEDCEYVRLTEGKG